MLLLRSARLDDLDALLELTKLTGFGLTTLPHDRDLLRRRIRESQRGFDALEEPAPPRGESYLLVMEDLATGAVVGTSGVVSKVGGFEPFYAYQVETTVTQSKALGVRKEIRTLHLVAEHNGPSEICSLFLRPEYRAAGHGRLLSLARFLFMAEHRDYFDPLVIAEMRGVISDQGCSPFWDALGRHFFAIEFPKADYLSMVSKRFIAELLPRHPVYELLLPEAARAVIGEVHPQTRPALRILEREGFRFSGMVGIFEGGPVVSCPLEEIRTVRQSVRGVVGDITDRPVHGGEAVIATTRNGLRACRARLEDLAEGGVRVDSATALALGVKRGEAVRWVAVGNGEKMLTTENTESTEEKP